MANGNSGLRAELYRLTLPPEGTDLGWLDVQVREMEALNERIPHSVRLHRRFSPPIYEVNCFMFALGIEADDVSDMRLGPVFPGKQFVESLLANGDLREVEGEGPIVIYFRDGAPEHAGRWGGAAVISKCEAAGTHIWRHALWDVPASYGDEARSSRRCRPPSRSTGVVLRTAAFERLARRTHSILLGADRRLRRGPHSALGLDGEQIILERLQHVAGDGDAEQHWTALWHRRPRIVVCNHWRFGDVG